MGLDDQAVQQSKVSKQGRWSSMPDAYSAPPGICLSAWQLQKVRLYTTVTTLPEACTIQSLEFIPAEAAKQASASLHSYLNPSHPSAEASQATASLNEADMTYATVDTVDEPAPVLKSSMKRPVAGAGARGSAGAGSGATRNSAPGGMKKAPAASGPQAAAARRKRDLEVAGYIDQLPLEYRGQDPVRLQIIRQDCM